MGLWAPVSSQEAWLCGGSGVVMDWGWILGHRGKQTVPFCGVPSSARRAPSPAREGREPKARAAGWGMGRDSFLPAPRLLPEVEIQILSTGAGSRAECGGPAGLPRVLGPV